MNKSEARDILVSCLKPPTICRVLFQYHNYDEFFFPLKVSEKLFLGVSENDFRLDGYTVRRLKDIVQAEPVRGTYLKIHRAEGTLNRLHLPPLPIHDWHTVCDALSASNELVILECDTKENENRFLCGKFTAVATPGIRFLPFDGDGVWQGHPVTILYNTITAITFGSRYITTFAKYLPPCPIS